MPMVLGLGLGCGGSEGASSVEPAPGPEAIEPEPDEPPGVPIRRPPVPGDDWRTWAAEHDAALRRDAPELHEALVALAPVTTRGGQRRLVDPRLHHPAVAPVLLVRLLDEPDAELRALLAEALPRTRGHYAMALAELLPREPSARARAAMATALTRASAPYALEGLEPALEDRDATVRRAAIDAIAHRSDGARLIDGLIGALDDPAAEVRYAAARCLGTLRDSAALPELERRLDDADPAMRLHALRAVSRVDASRLDDARLERMAGDADPKVRRLAQRLRAEALASP